MEPDPNHLPGGLEKEAVRIIESAADIGVPIRLIGGLAVFIRCGEKMQVTRREFSDMDFIMYGKDSEPLSKHLPGLGYNPNKRFNALYGASRMMFENPSSQMHFDVLIDQFKMCHTLPILGRLELDTLTLPLCDLLLTKLQVIRLTEKDLADCYSLLLAFDIQDSTSPTGIDRGYISRVCGGDWGWYRTVTLNLGKIRDLAQTDLMGADRDRLTSQVDALNSAIEGAPKSVGWKVRAVVGDRLPWYEQPEEVNPDRPV